MPDNIYYLRRVAPEHKKPKFMKWLEANLIPLSNCDDILREISSKFDIDKAVGLQLDSDGEVVGRDRLLSFEPSDGSSPLLGDNLYRILQKAKISMNQWDGTIPGVISLWENLFPEYGIVIDDLQDMTMNLYILGHVPELVKELMSRGYIAPKPEGVRINYEFNYEEDYNGRLCSGVSFSMANHYTFYGRLDEKYLFESIARTGGAYTEVKEYVMK